MTPAAGSCFVHSCSATVSATVSVRPPMTLPMTRPFKKPATVSSKPFPQNAIESSITFWSMLMVRIFTFE
ncbi:hypothetical protein D3C83_42220 [compost metagenome]